MVVIEGVTDFFPDPQGIDGSSPPLTFQVTTYGKKQTVRASVCQQVLTISA